MIMQKHMHTDNYNRHMHSRQDKHNNKLITDRSIDYPLLQAYLEEENNGIHINYVSSGLRYNSGRMNVTDEYMTRRCIVLLRNR